jgi:metal-responsive CopG/Arc/MetJ family transcriptional regulator
MANVTVTLPINMLDKLDDLIEKRKIASRSQAVRDALERYLKSLE